MQFEVGDRVVVLAETPELREGASGTIVSRKACGNGFGSIPPDQTYMTIQWDNGKESGWWDLPCLGLNPNNKNNANYLRLESKSPSCPDMRDWLEAVTCGT